MQIDAGSLIQRAIDKGVPLEQMERLLAMRRELKAEWAKEQFFAALSSFQRDCPVIGKESSVDFQNKAGRRTHYKYASLDQIVGKVKDILEKWGFSYVIKSEQTVDQVRSICIAHHRDGHQEETSFAIPIDHESYMNEAQKVASALTYSKRYAFCNAFGIMTGDEDDDAQATTKLDPKTEVKGDVVPVAYEVGAPKVEPPKPTVDPTAEKRSWLKNRYLKLCRSKWITEEDKITMKFKMKTADRDLNKIQQLVKDYEGVAESTSKAVSDEEYKKWKEELEAGYDTGDFDP
jgi:hypothetical protein